MMEMFEGMSYDSIMSIPSTRRHRFCLRKNDLEVRRDKKRQDAARRRK